jgi:hypothetical protein
VCRYLPPFLLQTISGQIAVEKDHDKFTALIKELNRLLDGEPPSLSTNRT